VVVAVSRGVAAGPVVAAPVSRDEVVMPAPASVRAPIVEPVVHRPLTAGQPVTVVPVGPVALSGPVVAESGLVAAAERRSVAATRSARVPNGGSGSGSGVGSAGPGAGSVGAAAVLFAVLLAVFAAVLVSLRVAPSRWGSVYLVCLIERPG
jgi:hypothetical protein